MALNNSLFWAPWPIFLGALVLVVSVIIVLVIVERKMRKKVKLKREEESTYFQRKLESAKNLRGNPERFLNAMDRLAKEFFEKEFQIQERLRYVELIELLKKKNEKKAVVFCEKMQEALYSGMKLDDNHLRFLFETLGSLIREKEAESLKKEEMEKIAEKTEEKTVAEITKYLTVGRERGFEISALKKKLLENDYKEADINRVIERLGEEKKAVVSPKLESVVIEKGDKPKIEPEIQKPEAIVIKRSEKPKIEPEIQQPEQIVIKKSAAPEIKPEKKVLAEFFRMPKREEKEVIEINKKTPKSVIEIVPYKNQRVRISGVKPRAKEPPAHKVIGSMDDLMRIRKKIEEKKKTLALQGHRGVRVVEEV